MWRLGFFFHEMGFGLLSIFLPLYMVNPTIGGSLVDIGVMSAVALLLTIPASFFWGYICDKTRRYKRYILASFLGSTILLYLLTLTISVPTLILIYAFMSFLHAAHEPPKNVLIAELYSRQDWEKSFAFYEGFTETGWLIGLIIGFFVSTFPILGIAFPLILCSLLNLVALVISAMLVADPMLVFERSLVNLEKSVDFTFQGVSVASRILGGAGYTGEIRRENVTAFWLGLVLFSLATSVLFTPMPVFVSGVIQKANLPSGLVFAVFSLNSMGGVFGYVHAGRRPTAQGVRPRISRIALLRGLFSLALLTVFLAWNPVINVLFVTVTLILMGSAYALFLVYTLSLSMELIPSGKAGLFNVLVGVGAACGALFGSVVAAQAAGFSAVFIIAGVIFLMSFLLFKVFSSSQLTL